MVADWPGWLWELWARAPCYNCGAALGCLHQSAATLALGTAASKPLPISASSNEPVLCFSAKPVPNHRLTKILCHKLSWVAGASWLSPPACLSPSKATPLPIKNLKAHHTNPYHPFMSSACCLRVTSLLASDTCRAYRCF